jgi:hypothetical protein
VDISLSYVRRYKWDAGPRVIGEAFWPRDVLEPYKTTYPINPKTMSETKVRRIVRSSLVVDKGMIAGTSGAPKSTRRELHCTPIQRAGRAGMGRPHAGRVR